MPPYSLQVSLLACLAAFASSIHVGGEDNHLSVGVDVKDCENICKLLPGGCTYYPPLGFDQPEGFDGEDFCKTTCKDEEVCKAAGPPNEDTKSDDKGNSKADNPWGGWGKKKSNTDSDSSSDSDSSTDSETDSDAGSKTDSNTGSDTDSSSNSDSDNDSQSSPASSSSSKKQEPLTVPPTLDEAVSRLWEIEAPLRLVPGKGLKLNIQAQGARNPLSNGKLTDNAAAPLITSVNENGKDEVEKAFEVLLDNYRRDSRQRESCNQQCKKEEDAFTKAVGNTAHMKYVYEALKTWQQQGYLPDLGYGWYETFPDYEKFLEDVKTAWFTRYMGGKSSGFEHVFVGEEKQKSGSSEITGLHNWRQYYEEEKKKKINYLGYAKKPDPDNLILSIKFEWKDDDSDIELKPISTFLMGSTVAFDFASSTMIFFGYGTTSSLSYRDRPSARISGHDVKFTCYTFNDNRGRSATNKQLLRTVYLE